MAVESVQVKQSGMKVMSGRRYELCIPNRVRFSYQDRDEPVSHRFVLYWQYNKAGDGFNVIGNYMNYWQDNGYHMPIGLGLTDSHGYLLPVSHPPGFSISDIAFDTQHHPVDRTVSYQRPIMSTKQSRDNIVALVTAADYSSTRTATRFTSNDVAFMLLPVDNPNLDTWQSKDLIELANHSPMVVKTSIIKQGQEVKLPCPLMEWDWRLQQQNIKLEQAIKRYQEIIAPHLAEIAKLENIRHFQQIHYRYPLHKAQRDKEGSEAIINNIKNLQQAISDQYITNEAENTYCGAAQAEVIEQGKQLFELLEHPALREELQRYSPYLDGEAGPEAQQESDWRKIYDTLIDSYGMLATAPESLSSKVFSEHVDPMLDYILALNDNLQAKDGIDEAFARNFNEVKSNSRNKDTILVYVVSEWLKNTYGHVANSPGPPSLGIAVINAYGAFIAGKFDPLIHKQEAAKSFRLLIGLLTMLNGGKDVGFRVKRDLYLALTTKDMAAGNKKISDYLESLPTHQKFIYFTFSLKVLMFIYSVGALQHAWQADTLNTWYEWSKMVTASADLGMSGMGLAASAVRFFNLSWTGAFTVGVEMAGRVLGVAAGLATAVSSGIKSMDRYSKNDNFGGFVSFVSMAGSGLVTLGYIFGYIVLGTTATVSLALVVGAITVTLLEPILLSIRNSIRESSQKTFYALLHEFEKNPRGLYVRSYSDNENITAAFSNIEKAAFDLHWWSMSWRAIVPLYESGVVNYKGGDQINMNTTARLIAQAIDIPKPKAKSHVDRRRFTKMKLVQKYLQQYESIKRGEKQHVSNCGNNSHDWLHGVALPFDLPAPIYEDAL